MSEQDGMLAWLEDLYGAPATDENGDDRGFSLRSVDNPGWLLEADLRRLPRRVDVHDRVITVRGEPPSAQNGNVGGAVWLVCEINDGRFVGAGDPTQLRVILEMFRDVVEGGATASGAEPAPR